MAGEIRIPTALLEDALQQKQTRALRFFAVAKLHGHRCHLNDLYKDLKISHSTGQRMLKRLLDAGWIGTDGTFVFTRSWERIGVSKRRGLYICEAPKNLNHFEALCFAHALKKILQKKSRSATPGQRNDQANAGLPTSYLFKAMRLTERRFERLKSTAQRYKYVSSIPQFKIIGRATEYEALSKHLHVPVFKRGKHTETPEPAKIKVLI